jgi:energy-coupling factor transporter ATP-binding protein EcfA2
MNAIAFNGVTKKYGDVVAVDGLSLDIPAGSTVALLGPNGAGKSTSINMLLGLLRPTSGEITLTYGKAGALLEVADNGVAGPYEPGSGLTGLTERVGAAGGSVEAEPSPTGFRLRIVVPSRPLERERGRAVAV